MTDEARRTYRRFSTFFLAIGAAFLGLGLVGAGLASDVLRGNPIPVALLLLVIGGALRWTVRKGAPGHHDVAGVEETPHGPRAGEHEEAEPRDPDGGGRPPGEPPPR